MAGMAVVDFVPPEAESTEDVRKRMKSFFNVSFKNSIFIHALNLKN